MPTDLGSRPTFSCSHPRSSSYDSYLQDSGLPAAALGKAATHFIIVLPVLNPVASILRNTAHSVCVEGIETRDGQDPPTIGNNDVFVLANDCEASLLQARTACRCGMPGIFGTTP